ncbi:hypothetical protein HMI54_000229 [Coelomomyces lativittatus]|nr:hypothetical protein HMI56_007683 [Coelomomyces lativittatus]KAJ1512176.1 hypothetical protein HMI54_000229 [Coelomomyces lativittatus]KAJ1516772.1 hypothetical protein HMI55_001438 [Coelomomyces lativittatus]
MATPTPTSTPTLVTFTTTTTTTTTTSTTSDPLLSRMPSMSSSDPPLPPPTCLEERDQFQLVHERQVKARLLYSKDEQLLALLSLHSSSLETRKAKMTQTELVNAAFRSISGIPEFPHLD